MWTRREFASAAAGLSLAAAEDFTAGLPDFSGCGYRGGGVALPEVPVRAELSPEAGDATARIQAAIDAMVARGERGALLLKKGQYAVAGTVRISASGIVLRGEGSGEDGSVLLGTGTVERALVEVKGASAGRAKGAPVAIVDEVVPVGAVRFRVASVAGLQVGQVVLVRRQGNADWIHRIGMDRIPARPGEANTTEQWKPFALEFERAIVAVDGNVVTVDAPVLCAIEKEWGGGEVVAFDDSGRVRECGVESLRGVSEFNAQVKATYGREKSSYFSDEAHAKDFIALDAANDCWVRDVAARRFSECCVHVKRARQVTVTGCNNGEMVSIITGSRRYSFHIATGQRNLVERCQSESGRHDFVFGSRVAGPNVFLDCEARNAFATSEPHHRWSVGGLYDNVKADIAVQDRGYYGTGHGWAGANYVLWNCEGKVVAQKPPTADNWVVGHVGARDKGAFAPREEATWRSYGKHVTPRSLYEHQLKQRK